MTTPKPSPAGQVEATETEIRTARTLAQKEPNVSTLSLFDAELDEVTFLVAAPTEDAVRGILESSGEADPTEFNWGTYRVSGVAEHRLDTESLRSDATGDPISLRDALGEMAGEPGLVSCSEW